MFSGIVEELGKVKGIYKLYDGIRLSIETKSVYEDVSIGDSLSVNGVCLTVVDIKKNVLSFDCLRHTFRLSNLGKLRLRDKVNLERSLKVEGRLSGHFVTGHVDAVARIIDKDVTSQDMGGFLKIEIPADFLDFVQPRGSIAIDGVSLTVSEIEGQIVRVEVIPHTLKVTTLGFKKKGDWVNVEVDILARYCHGLIQGKSFKVKRQLSEGFLKEYGFI